jgi:hypothetical protein
MTTGALLRRISSRSTRSLAGEPYTGIPQYRRGRTKRHGGHPLTRKRQQTPPGFSSFTAIGYQSSAISYQFLVVGRRLSIGYGRSVTHDQSPATTPGRVAKG